MRTKLCSSVTMATFTAALLAVSTAGATPVVYYGGRVISNVEVVEVAWTSGVDPAYLTKLEGFYSALVKGRYIDWLSEYDTIGKAGFADMLPGSNQHIGRGTFAGTSVITPVNTSTSLTNADIAAELEAQITSGAIPPPKLDAGGNVNTLYMIDLPFGYDVTIPGGQACVHFYAFHSSFEHEGRNVPYGVHPGCAFDFKTSTIAHSHELVEAITDAEFGAANFPPITRPIAWAAMADADNNVPEAGDLCVGTTDVIAGYTVQRIWSNFAGACVAQIPICDGTATPPSCRPCGAFDEGAACSDKTPLCATSGPKAGQCVACTADATAACTGATPLCDDATSTCVGCLSDADCSASAPICDAVAKSCRGCDVDAECALDERCDAHTCAPPVPVDPPAEDPAGCNCRVASRPRGATSAWLGLVLLPLMRRRRRRAGAITRS